MRLVLKIDYRYIVFGADANVTGILQAIEGAQVCESKGYGPTENFVPSESSSLEVMLLNSTDGRLPDLLDSPNKARLLAETTEKKDALQLEVYKLQNELKKATTPSAPVGGI